ncbi:MAG: hypothetical protein D6714_15365 [Bacteroidetes bacterium]|nr:MAG: hypothetical protein D6714_15365 [Bacteroidota bacterium]
MSNSRAICFLLLELFAIACIFESLQIFLTDSRRQNTFCGITEKAYCRHKFTVEWLLSAKSKKFFSAF